LAEGIVTFLWSIYLQSQLDIPDAFYTIPNARAFVSVSTEVSNKHLLSD